MPVMSRLENQDNSRNCKERPVCRERKGGCIGRKELDTLYIKQIYKFLRLAFSFGSLVWVSGKT